MALANPLSPRAVSGSRLSRSGAWLWSFSLWSLFICYCVFTVIQVPMHTYISLRVTSCLFRFACTAHVTRLQHAWLVASYTTRDLSFLTNAYCTSVRNTSPPYAWSLWPCCLKKQALSLILHAAGCPKNSKTSQVYILFIRECFCHAKRVVVLLWPIRS